MNKPVTLTLISLALASAGAVAAVSPEQAAQLGKTLTPMGAEMAGNADGSIPAWDPKGTPVAANFVPGSDNYVDPYPDEKPLYTITADNWQQYADNLTIGTRAMFEKYGADGWEMHVYPSHRGAIRPRDRSGGGSRGPALAWPRPGPLPS